MSKLCISKNILVVVDAYKKRPFKLGSWMHLDLHKNQLIAKSMTWCFTDFSILGKSSHFTDYYIIYDSQKHFLFWKVQYICMVTNQLEIITKLFLFIHRYENKWEDVLYRYSSYFSYGPDNKKSISNKNEQIMSMLDWPSQKSKTSE